QHIWICREEAGSPRNPGWTQSACRVPAIRWLPGACHRWRNWLSESAERTETVRARYGRQHLRVRAAYHRTLGRGHGDRRWQLQRTRSRDLLRLATPAMAPNHLIAGDDPMIRVRGRALGYG